MLLPLVKISIACFSNTVYSCVMLQYMHDAYIWAFPYGTFTWCPLVTGLMPVVYWRCTHIYRYIHQGEWMCIQVFDVFSPHPTHNHPNLYLLPTTTPSLLATHLIYSMPPSVYPVPTLAKPSHHLYFTLTNYTQIPTSPTTFPHPPIPLLPCPCPLTFPPYATHTLWTPQPQSQLTYHLLLYPILSYSVLNVHTLTPLTPTLHPTTVHPFPMLPLNPSPLSDPHPSLSLCYVYTSLLPLTPQISMLHQTPFSPHPCHLIPQHCDCAS